MASGFRQKRFHSSSGSSREMNLGKEFSPKKPLHRRDSSVIVWRSNVTGMVVLFGFVTILSSSEPAVRQGREKKAVSVPLGSTAPVVPVVETTKDFHSKSASATNLGERGWKSESSTALTVPSAPAAIVPALGIQEKLAASAAITNAPDTLASKPAPLSLAKTTDTRLEPEAGTELEIEVKVKSEAELEMEPEAKRGEPELDDIRHFSEDSAKTENKISDVLSEASVSDEYPNNLENGDRLSEICLDGLAPYLALFRDHPATTAWANEIEELVTESLQTIKTDPVSARRTLERLAGLVVREDKRMTDAFLQENSPALLPLEWKTVASASADSNLTDFRTADSSEKYGSARFNSASDAKENSVADRLRVRRKLVEYLPSERRELLWAFRYRLDRRVFLWTFAVDYFEAARTNRLPESPNFTESDILSLLKKTEEVRDYFGVHEIGRKWRQGFEVDALCDILSRIHRLQTEGMNFQPTFTQTAGETAPKTDIGPLAAALAKSGEAPTPILTAEEILRGETSRLCDHLNSICYKIGATAMTDEQKRIFESPLLAGWRAEMSKYRSDRTDPLALLLLFEEYERTGGGEAGRELGRCAYRMKSSLSEPGRKFGEAVGVIFDNPNVKIYVSELFLNRFLPIRDPEFDVVQETILNNPVAGNRRTDTQVKIKLVPDNSRLMMDLIVNGKIVAATRSNVFPARLFNESQATYLGQKRLEWTGDRIVYDACRVAVNSQNRLNGVQTNVDFVPLLGELTREVVRGQYQSRQDEIQKETKGKITREVKRRIDQETKDRFDTVNDRLAKNFFEPLEAKGMSLSMQNSRTTDDWLLASLRLSERGAPGSQTPEPPTLPGAFADVKIHQSAVNIALSQLEIAGRDFTPPELLAHLATVLNRPKLAELAVEDPGVVFGLADKDPIAITFYENRIQLRLRFAFIELGDRLWENIETTISYQPSFDTNGNAYLVRDGLISLDGPLGIRAQIPLRAMFAKIFPSRGVVPLKPKFFDKDERFAGLSIGLCRITDGWFAVSVIQPSAVYRQAVLPVPSLK